MMKLFLTAFFATHLFSAPNNQLTQYSLTTHEGKQITLNDFRGSYLFLSFVFSRCPMPEMCPLTLQLNKKLSKLWQREFPNTPIKFVLVTLDPETDTPTVLKKYKNDVGLGAPQFIFATGKKDTLSELASEFNVVAFPKDGTLSHNLKSILLGPDLAEIHEFKDNEWKPEDVITQFKNSSQKMQKRG